MHKKLALSRPCLVVEDDDDAGGGQELRVGLGLARRQPDVLQAPVEGDHLGGNQVELVDPEFFLALLLPGLGHLHGPSRLNLAGFLNGCVGSRIES